MCKCTGEHCLPQTHCSFVPLGRPMLVMQAQWSSPGPLPRSLRASEPSESSALGASQGQVTGYVGCAFSTKLKFTLLKSVR